MLFVYSMEYGRYKILYRIEIINVFLKKRVAGGRKKNGMSKEHAVCRNVGEPYQLRSAVSRTTAEMTSALPAHP